MRPFLIVCSILALAFVAMASLDRPDALPHVRVVVVAPDAPKRVVIVQPAAEPPPMVDEAGTDGFEAELAEVHAAMRAPANRGVRRTFTGRVDLLR